MATNSKMSDLITLNEARERFSSIINGDGSLQLAFDLYCLAQEQAQHIKGLYERLADQREPAITIQGAPESEVPEIDPPLGEPAATSNGSANQTISVSHELEPGEVAEEEVYGMLKRAVTSAGGISALSRHIGIDKSWLGKAIRRECPIPEQVLAHFGLERLDGNLRRWRWIQPAPKIDPPELSPEQIKEIAETHDKVTDSRTASERSGFTLSACSPLPNIDPVSAVSILRQKVAGATMQDVLLALPHLNQHRSELTDFLRCTGSLIGRLRMLSKPQLEQVLLEYEALYRKNAASQGYTYKEFDTTVGAAMPSEQELTTMFGGAALTVSGYGHLLDPRTVERLAARQKGPDDLRIREFPA